MTQWNPKATLCAKPDKEFLSRIGAEVNVNDEETCHIILPYNFADGHDK